MQDKGYDFPLYSLDLLGPAEVPPEEARYLFPVPAGRLRVAAALRRRAARCSTVACEEAVARALAAWALAPGGFARYGLDHGWAEALGRWRRELTAQELRVRALAARQRGQGSRPLVEAGRRLWGRLSLAAQLAGLSGLVTRGPAPWQAAALRAALAEAGARAGRHAETLARHGFSAEDRASLLALLPQLDEAVAARPGRRWALAEEAARLHTLRAALLGDVALLFRVAPRVLPESQRRKLSQRPLLRGAAGR